MIKTDFDRQWKLKIMNNLTLKMSNGAYVDLPHDYSITQKMQKLTPATASNAFLPGGVIEYEKTIYAPKEWIGRKVIIEFEGVYMNSVVRVNSNIIGKNPYGYTSFHCDLTPYLKLEEENIITVYVNNSMLPNTRWYSGMGIYRHVWLMVGREVHLEPWGIFVTTPIVELVKSVIGVKTKFTSISDNNEKVILKQVLMDDIGKEISKTELYQELAPKETREVLQNLELSNAKLWSPGNPYLYKLITEIIKGGEVIDFHETKVGIRKIEFDTKNGFMLNNVSLKLKGGCVHHDCGILGASAYDRAEQRKVQLLKENGYNAIRCAHNPPSPAFLDACDALGMLVIDEAFDCWNENKMTNDYSMFFKEWWQKDMSSMILRDRNHPSIIMWSIGNEIPERDGRSEGYKYAEELSAFVRSFDDTRAVTNALCNIANKDKWADITAPFVKALDVVGYNYLLERYEEDGKIFPERIICGTETFPKDALDYWNAVEKLPYVIGDFVWTGLDYLGEAGIGRVLGDNDPDFVGEYPWSHAHCGDIDICGFKRPQSYYRDCVWGISQKPYIAVHNPLNHGKELKITPWGWPDVYSCWTWPSYEGKPVKIDIYCVDDEVELYLNNKSLGRKPTGKANKFLASFELDYEQGELLVVGLSQNAEVSRTTLITAEKPEELHLIPDRDTIDAVFGDLCYITAITKDKNGNLVDNADNSVYFTVNGAGSLLAVGNSNPKSEELYTGNVRKLHCGKAMAVIRANGTDGEITITASAEGLKTACIIINAV